MFGKACNGGTHENQIPPYCRNDAETLGFREENGANQHFVIDKFYFLTTVTSDLSIPIVERISFLSPPSALQLYKLKGGVSTNPKT